MANDEWKMIMPWFQVYDPLGSPLLSTLVAGIPIVVLLGALAFLKVKAHYAALLGLASSLLIAILVFRMPVKMAVATAVFGAAYGLLPIGWIILNVIFLYQLTNERGLFDVLRESITGLTEDRRLQLLLVAFSFGAFFEGASGFGTPVAVTGAILMGLGFSPLAASGLSLIAMVGRQLPFFSLIVPFWLIWAFAGFRGMLEIWPAILVAGICFAVPQFLISNFHGPWLVDVVSAIISMGALALFIKVWRPAHIWRFPGEQLDTEMPSHGMDQVIASTEPCLEDELHQCYTKSAIRNPQSEIATGKSKSAILHAWLPWLILSVVVFVWGLPQTKTFLDSISFLRLPISGLDKLVMRIPPVVIKPTPEAAVFNWNWLSATGSGIFLAAIIAGLLMGYSPGGLARVYWKTIKLVRFSLLTIAAMLAIAFTTRYSGMDATLGLAFARTGYFYPFFGAMLGWLGVALTGSDTSSNVLFGSLQKITAEQLGLSPVLMAAANSSGGVMGKMIDAQSIVVASTATRWYGHEGKILRYVFFHSLALAALVGLLVMLQAYVFKSMVVR